MRIEAIAVLLTATLGSVSAYPITMDGIGPVQLGRSVRDISKTAGESLVDAADKSSATDGCHHVRFATTPSLLFMVEDGRVVRVETGNRRFQTASGVRVGDSEEKARRVYCMRLEITRHKYIDEGHYFTVRSADRTRALVMETNGKNVTYIRAGLVPAAEYVEGCL